MSLRELLLGWNGSFWDKDKEAAESCSFGHDLVHLKGAGKKKFEGKENPNVPVKNTFFRSFVS